MRGRGNAGVGIPSRTSHGMSVLRALAKPARPLEPTGSTAEHRPTRSSRVRRLHGQSGIVSGFLRGMHGRQIVQSIAAGEGMKTGSRKAGDGTGTGRPTARAREAATKMHLLQHKGGAVRMRIQVEQAMHTVR